MAEWRKARASDLVATISLEDVKPSLWQNFLELSGKCFDFKSRYHEAYIKFKEMNALSTSSEDFKKFDRGRYLENAEIKYMLRLKFVETKNLLPTKGPFNPVFIGFPRSGTTLLDTILSHIHYSVVEEQPMLHNTEKYLIRLGVDLRVRGKLTVNCVGLKILL